MVYKGLQIEPGPKEAMGPGAKPNEDDARQVFPTFRVKLQLEVQIESHPHGQGPVEVFMG